MKCFSFRTVNHVLLTVFLLVMLSTGGFAGLHDPVKAASAPTAAKYEAERAALSGGAYTASGTKGFSGKGYVVYPASRTGTSNSFSVNISSPGNKKVTFRYSNGNAGSRTLNLYINGAKKGTLTFSPTGKWYTWKDKLESITLKQGINTIALKADKGNSASVYLDYILVEGAATVKPATPTPENDMPVAKFTVDPNVIRPAGTNFTFDASGCTDNRDASGKLLVRWDWENDGIWDTPYSTEKKAVHAFQDEKGHTVAMEVKDSKGNTSKAYDLVVTGWRPFSDDSPWNTKIPSSPKIDANTKELVRGLGDIYINMAKFSIPVYYVDSEKTPKYNVLDTRPGICGDGFQVPNQIPIPDGATPSLPEASKSGDAHMCIVDKYRNLEWGMWFVENKNGQWSTGLGAVTDLKGTGVRPPVNETEGYTSHTARASGFPLIAGLIRIDEIKAGRIDHALVFAYNKCRSEYFMSPASTAQVRMMSINHNSGIPMGGRIQLDPSFDVENSDLSRAGKIIARALQEYGAYCGDYAGATVLYAESSPQALKEWEGILGSEDLYDEFFVSAVRKYFRVLSIESMQKGQNYENY